MTEPAPNIARDRHLRTDPTPSSPRAVRCFRRLVGLASTAGVSARALQRAFVRHRETTPMAYLRRVTGRFAASYRDALGVNPSQTLRD